MSNPLAQRYRLVLRVVVLQTGIALLVAAAFVARSGAGAGLAALVGGLIVVAGSALFGWRLFAPGIAGGATLTRAMFAAAALKWVWFIGALYLALARWRLDAAPLLVGLIVAQLGHWAALVRLKK
jgi:F0F1-type ATP synthase assembly protein I